jgi:large subunit ribosomal protein L25
MAEVNLKVEPRTATGKGANRRARAAGAIPGVVYGGGKEAVTIQLDRRTFTDLFRHGATENQIFLLQLSGTDKSRHAMIRDLQRDPISHRVMHIDFLRINMSDKVRVKVPIEVSGLAYGVKNEGAVLDFVTREVEVECLPGDIPSALALDVTELHVNQHVEARQLTMPNGVALLDSPDRVIVALSHSKTEKEAEAAAATAEPLLEAAAAEPEVIKKGKTDEEGAAEKPGEKGADKAEKPGKK